MADDRDPELGELRSMIRELHDIEEIKALHSRFWYACDGDLNTGRTHNTEELLDLFTHDASYVMPPVGVGGVVRGGFEAHGRDALSECFGLPHRNVPFAMHFGVTPIIEVDGDNASGKWKVLALTTSLVEQAFWTGVYHDAHYRRTSNGWRIRELVCSVTFNTPYEEGWASTRFAALARDD